MGPRQFPLRPHQLPLEPRFRRHEKHQTVGQGRRRAGHPRQTHGRERFGAFQHDVLRLADDVPGLFPGMGAGRDSRQGLSRRHGRPHLQFPHGLFQERAGDALDGRLRPDHGQQALHGPQSGTETRLHHQGTFAQGQRLVEHLLFARITDRRQHQSVVLHRLGEIRHGRGQPVDLLRGQRRGLRADALRRDTRLDGEHLLRDLLLGRGGGLQPHVRRPHRHGAGAVQPAREHQDHEFPLPHAGTRGPRDLRLQAQIPVRVQPRLHGIGTVRARKPLRILPGGGRGMGSVAGGVVETGHALVVEDENPLLGRPGRQRQFRFALALLQQLFERQRRLHL